MDAHKVFAPPDHLVLMNHSLSRRTFKCRTYFVCLCNWQFNREGGGSSLAVSSSQSRGAEQQSIAAAAFESKVAALSRFFL